MKEFISGCDMSTDRMLNLYLRHSAVCLSICEQNN